jgi:hypothetical protein
MDAYALAAGTTTARTQDNAKVKQLCTYTRHKVALYFTGRPMRAERRSDKAVTYSQCRHGETETGPMHFFFFALV